MKNDIKNKAKGTFHEMKGKVKEVSGKVSDNPKLEAEGVAEKVAGKGQRKVGEIETVLDD